MKGTPLIETGNSKLIVRAYNLGLKIVPNLPHVLDLEGLEYWENHLEELRGNLKRCLAYKKTQDKLRNGPLSNRFRLIGNFELMVPENYNHATQLDSFRKRWEEKFHFFDDNITDQNFNKVSVKLIPGRRFRIKIFQIIGTVTSEECLKFQKSQKVILTGPQGASLVYDQYRNKLPGGYNFISFDKKENLWINSDGSHCMPYINLYSTYFFFFLRTFETVWHYYPSDDGHEDYCLLCFCDLSAKISKENK